MSELRNTSLSHLYLTTLWNYRWLLAVSTTAALALCALYLILADPVYEAQVRVLIQNRGLAIRNNKTSRDDETFLRTQAEVVRSPLTVGRALKRLPFAPEAESVDDEEPVTAVTERLRVNAMAETDIVKVTYQCREPRQAVDRLRTIIASYRDHLRESEQHTSSETLRLLSQREQSLRRELESVQEKYAALRQKSPFIGESKRGVSVETASLKDLTNRLNKVRGRRLRLENALEAITEPTTNTAENESRLGALTALDGQGVPALTEIRRDVQQARARTAEVRSLYKTGHPARRSAENQLASLEQQYRQRMADAEQQLRTQLKIVRDEQQRLSNLREDERMRLKKLDEYLVREEQLRNNIDRLEKMHQSTSQLLQDRQLTDQALDKGQASILVQVLDEYVVPENPVWPRPVPLLGLCGLFGFLAAVVGIVWTEGLPWPGSPADSPGFSSVTNQSAKADQRSESLDESLHRQTEEMQQSVAVYTQTTTSGQ